RAALRVVVVEERPVQVVGGVELAGDELGVRLDVIREDADIEVEAVLGEDRLDEFEDLRVRNGGGADDERVVRPGGTEGGKREAGGDGEGFQDAHVGPPGAGHLREKWATRRLPLAWMSWTKTMRIATQTSMISVWNRW